MSTYSRTSSPFIMIPCRCGRILRAKWDQVGSDIVCWDCQASSPVLIPRERLRLAGQLYHAFFDLLRRPGSSKIMGAGVLVMLALLIPYAGLGLATLVLAGGLAILGDKIQLPDEPNDAFEIYWAQLWKRLTWSRGVVALLFALTLVTPLWVVHANLEQSPHFDQLSLTIYLLGLGVMPLLMAAVYVEPIVPGARRRSRIRFVRDHPLCTILVLAIVPLALLACELVVAGLLYSLGLLPLHALDYMPVPGNLIFEGGYFYSGSTCYVDLPQERFIRGYFSGLVQGYSFVGAIPPSMSLATSRGLDPHGLQISETKLYWLRAWLVFLISLGLAVSLSLQARCLAVLANIHRHRLP